MRSMYKIFFIMLAVAFVCVGCAKDPFQPPEEMYNPDGSIKKSLILEHVDYPRETALIIRLASYELVERAEVITPQQYEDYVRSLMEYIQSPSSTYFELFMNVQEKVEFLNNEVSGEIFILSGVLMDIGSNKIEIYEGDKILLMYHLQDHLETALYMQRNQ